MKKRMLWIEDDFYAIKGLVRPLELAGFQIESATSAMEGYLKAQSWQEYDIIFVDLIMPLRDDEQPLPDTVAAWNDEQYIGIGLVKWLLQDLHVKCPILILSVVRDPIATYQLQEIGLAGYLPKRGLLPSQVKDEVYRQLGIKS
jgi:CheY-like chemotaxis protein